MKMMKPTALARLMQSRRAKRAKYEKDQRDAYAQHVVKTICASCEHAVRGEIEAFAASGAMLNELGVNYDQPVIDWSGPMIVGHCRHRIL